MRKVIVSHRVRMRLDELEQHLTGEYKMSREASKRRVRTMYRNLAVLACPVDFALCRFKRWNALGYRCLPVLGWVFAYENLPEGVIIRDMMHGSVLHDVD